ncbi:MAG TPA: LuxR C-terminal-related transcriptional regulator [Solirubrobacteraceae bacterium]|nr:LuxR C-terminal-related transcriptional regulator [Solirubrobacteraceae bacterium]
MAVPGSDLVGPLLRTKLAVPSFPRLVVRESLIDAISAGLWRPLTLVYGPAGSGKTMLVAQWEGSTREERPVAWLSLEAGDNDPARFWIYVIEALRSVLPGIGEASLAMLRAPGVNLNDEALPPLVNELADASEQFVLVLDDYQAIEDQRIHEGMASLIEHLPATLRLVMTSRAEPPLRIGTLRARGQLNEIDAVQLRFSLSEAESMLNDVHGLDLTPQTVKRLHDRTEGWAAGLYLAVLSMRGREDATGFVASFTGSDRRVVDYLAAELLEEQRESELDFLLHTGVLDSFCAPLCDAVTGRRDSRAMLDRIERTNYFLIPLDPRHDWYRYHHLFSELLRHELERRQPEYVAELHHRAGSWFLDTGMVSEAIGHLTAAGEFDAASELIDNHWLAFTNAGQRDTVARWLDNLPGGYIAGDGRLCLTQARTALAVGERGEVSRWVDLATQAPRNNPGDDVELGHEVTVIRAAACQLLGDMRQAEQLAQRLAPLDGSSIWHSLAACLLGTSARSFDANDDAQVLFETAIKLGSGRQNFIVSMLALGRLALIAADRGDWLECTAKVQAAFGVVRANGLEEYWICSSAHIARGRLFRHDRRPTEAHAELERAVSLARRGAGPVELSYALTTLAELRRERGDRRAARDLVREARELISGAPEPGTLAPRLLERSETALRLVVDLSGSRPVVTDELTAREQTVLDLLPTGMSAKEIAAELGISRDTVKTHTKRIYQKLGVSSRPGAVSRGRELGLL